MRKNKDYSDIENILNEKANKLESGVRYSGAVRDSQDEKRVKREKEQKGSYGFPVKQLIAAALTMVIVGAGTFGALKFLEYKGAQRIAQQGGAGDSGTSQGEQVAYNDPETDNNRSNADEMQTVEPVDYNPNDGYGEGYVYVTSGDKIYQPFICKSSVMAVIDYVAPEFDYCGKLDIVNNVKDRDWTVLDADIWFPGIQSYDRTFDGLSIDQICEIINNGSSDRFRVYLKVTWDDPDDKNDVIYYVDFVIRKAAKSEVTETVEPVEYDPKGQNHSKYLYVTSGDKVYQPFIHDKSATVKVGHVLPTFEYNGKISFVNNVKDRDWHILTLYSTDPEKPAGFTYYTYSDGSIEDITLTEPGTYFFYAEVTWDDPDDENAVVYFVSFYVNKNAPGDKFENVTKFEIEYTANGDALELDIPVDHRAEYVQEAKCEAANAAGYRIFFYDAAPIEFSSIHLGACMYDENDRFMFEFMNGTETFNVKDIWYAEKTPSGHPTMFYITSHTDHTESVCYWTHADLYAYDVITEEKSLIISVGPEPYHSQSNLTVYGELLYENENLIVRLYENLNSTQIWNPYDKETWSEPFAAEPIKWDGEKYVVSGIDPIRSTIEGETETETEPETDDKELIEQIKAEAEGRLYVVSGDMQEYPPLMSAVIYGEDGPKTVETSNDLIEIEYAEPFEIRNGIRTMMYINGIDVTVATIDQNIEALQSFLHVIYENITEEQLIPVRISVHWNDDNIYEYGFLLRMIPYFRSETQTAEETAETAETPAETVEGPDAPVDHTAQIAELDNWLSQRMWYGMTTDDLVRGVGSLSDNGSSFKTRFLADDHSQLNVKEDYTFVAYRSEHYDIIFSPKNEEPHVLLEARVVMRRGAEFELPFGLTLDMSPEEALRALGYTDEQITAMDGYSFAANYELRYNDRFLRVSYQCNGADVGIELGSDPQMYIETAE